MATSTPYSKEKANHIRLCSLLVDIGRQVFQDVFDNIHPPSPLNIFLSTNRTTLNNLKTKNILYKKQWDTLFPASGTVTSADFDITLLFLLLRNICKLTAPGTGWDNPPLISDLSMEADLVRIKRCRNELYAHIINTAIPDNEFETLWGDIEAVLLRLGGTNYQVQIQSFKDETLDSEREKSFQVLLQSWEEGEEKTVHAILNGSAEILDAIGELHEAMISIKGTVKVWTVSGLAFSWVAGSAYIVCRYINEPETLIQLVQGAIIPSFVTGAVVYALVPGSFKILVKVRSLDALDKIWKSYNNGNMKKKLEKVIITDDMRILAPDEAVNVDISLMISEDEYEKARDYLKVSWQSGMDEAKAISLLDIEDGDCDSIQNGEIQFVVRAARICYDEKDYFKATQFCHELLDCTLDGWIPDGLLLIKIMFLMSKCYLELDEFIGAKTFLDRTYQLIIHICPERIHELDSYLIEIEERQGNIVGAFVLSIVFREVNQTENEQKLNYLKAQLAHSMTEMDIINKVFHPLFETAKVYLNDGEPILAVAIFKELMQILNIIQCDELLMNTLKNRVRMNLKLATSKLPSNRKAGKKDSYSSIASKHIRGDSSQTTWEGLPPSPAFQNDVNETFVNQSLAPTEEVEDELDEILVQSAPFTITEQSSSKMLPDDATEKTIKAERQSASLPKKKAQGNFSSGKFELQTQGLPLPKKKAQGSFASKQLGVQSQGLPRSNTQTAAAKNKPAKLQVSCQNRGQVITSSDSQSHLSVKQSLEESGDSSTTSQLPIKGKTANAANIPQAQATSLKPPSKLQVKGEKNKQSSDPAWVDIRFGEQEIVHQNRYSMPQGVSTTQELESYESPANDDNSESTSEESSSQITQEESMNESNTDRSDMESISSTSEVFSSTNENGFQTISRKKKRNRKGINLPQGVDVICEHFQENPTNSCKVCKNCESKCFYAFLSKESGKWERVRSSPQHLRSSIEFHSCTRYNKSQACKPDCSHPHGPEIDMWTMERQKGLPPPASCLEKATTLEPSSKPKRKKRRGGKRKKSKALESPQQPPTNPPAASSSRNLPQQTQQSSQSLGKSQPRRVCYLPKEVIMVCPHFLARYSQLPVGIQQRRNVCKPCIAKRAFKDIKYAFWSIKYKRWFEIRGRPSNVHPSTVFHDCKDFIRGGNCKRNPCCFGHGPEARLWTMDREGALVPPYKAYLCDIQDDSVNREGMIRPLPPVDYNLKFCPSVQTRIPCRLGRCCPNAHSKEELISWKEFDKEMVSAKEQQHQSHHQQQQQVHYLLEQHQNHPQQEQQHLLTEVADVPPRQQPFETTETLPGVTLTCNPENSNVTLTEDGDEHQHKWTFSIRYKTNKDIKLPKVLLGKRHSGYFHLESVQINAVDKHNKPPPYSKDLNENKVLSFKPPEAIVSAFESRDVEVKVDVRFRCSVFGSFAQSLLFEFDKEPLLIKEFNIDVISHIDMNETLQRLTQARQELSQAVVSFDESKIIRKESNNEDEQLFSRYKLPKDAETIVSAQMMNKSDEMTPDSYVQMMHQMLFAEEAHMKNLLSRLIPSDAKVKVSKSFNDESRGLTFAPDGSFFGTIELQTSITPDDMAGRVCIRKVQSILMQPRGDPTHVYEASIEVLKENQVIVQLFPRLVQDLKIEEGHDIDVQMWFNLNRVILCRMHRALDKLTETHKRFLFPVRQVIKRMKERVPPWLVDLDKELNENQLKVINAITEIQSPSAPLVVFGPFGTGKTLTLNRAILHLVTKQSNRVLLCTHTNSAADIHVKLLDDYITENKMNDAKPLRIIDPMRKVSTTSPVTRKYCLIDNDKFVLPSRQDVDKRRVVVTTLAAADLLTNLDVRHGFFTHILIDEAAQAWETEALIPIALAGPNTKIVFTGDHMQMSPEVYNKFACPYGLKTSLPERLFDHYSKMESTVFKDNHIMFLKDNYRSNSQILEFPSDYFYGGEIVAMGDKENPAHPTLGPLMLYTCRGKDIKQHDNTFLNAAEVAEVVKRVKEVAQTWPDCWGSKNLKEIAVLAPYRYQVKAIRDELRRAHLGQVTVDTIHNVQGLEFRALFISTVRTRASIQDLKESDDSLNLEFLSDPKLLVTAVTRAKSFVAVVGDPVSLCTLGECKNYWRDFISRCDKLGNLHGTTLAVLSREISDCVDLSKKLNPQAKSFVPGSSTELETQTSPEELVEDEEEESEENDDQSSVSSDDADDELEDHELRIEDPPRHVDKIIEALIRSIRADEAKKVSLRARGATPLEEEEEFPPSEMDLERRKPNLNRLNSSDYEMVRINGRDEIRLVALYHRVSDRAQRVQRTLCQDYTDNNQQGNQTPEVLKRMVEDEPSRYVIGQLRFGLNRSRTSYVEFPDKTKRDVMLSGEVRQAFDRDTIVIDTNKVKPTGSSKCDCIVGILSHLINPRERQYVCKLDDLDMNNKSLMVPINKSVPKIVNLSDKSSTKIPIYKKVLDSNHSHRPYKVRSEDPLIVRKMELLFVVQFLQWRPDCHYPLGIALRTIKKGEEVRDCLKIVKIEHGVRDAKDRKTETEAMEKFPPHWTIPGFERLHRKMVKNAFTIDPENSRDLDDAVSIDVLKNGSYRVGIHISDVSYFVKPGTKVDEDAKQRGTTYYPDIPDFEPVPMLPTCLSQNHCSLLEKKDRLTLSVYIIIDNNGEIIKYPDQTESTITRSCCRLTYSEAQRIIEHKPLQRQIAEEDWNLLQLSIPLLHSLAQKLRQRRLGAINHCNEKDDVAAHELIEEMMVLANQSVGRILSTRQHCTTPFNSHPEPKVHKLNEWVRRYGRYAKYNPYMNTTYLESEDVEDIPQEETTIEIFGEIWEQVQEFVRNGNHNMLHFLICHPRCSPQLQLANNSLKRIHQRAEYKRAQEEELIHHHGLGLDNYVHFTSPIRRYMDIVIHRQLSSDETEQDLDKIDGFCRRSTFIKDNSREFQRKCKRIAYAHKLKKCNEGVEVLVDELDTHSFVVQTKDPEQDVFFRHNNRIAYQDLSVFNDPDKPDENLETTLTWRVRIYISPSEREDNVKKPQYRERKSMKKHLLQLASGGSDVQDVYTVQGQRWLQLIEAVQAVDKDRITHLVLNQDILDGPRALDMEPYSSDNIVVEPYDEEGHYYTLSMKLKQFSSAYVQLFPRPIIAVLTPDIQLFKISSNFDICIEHRRLPRLCFAKDHHVPASKQNRYDSIDDYIEHWKPVLAIEVAAGAINHNEGFVLKSHRIKWNRNGGKIEGNFSLKESYCSNRQLEFKVGDLACVRIPWFGNEPDSKRSIWVGHCVFTKVDKLKTHQWNVTLAVKNMASEVPEIFFDENCHKCDMEVIYIPVPLRRMQIALDIKLKESSDLVQSICCGWRTGEGHFNVRKGSLSLADHYRYSGFHPLNEYQLKAVNKALQQSFSLIQGPPGTGKTVTGVHIAYWFTKQNLKLETLQGEDTKPLPKPDEESEDGEKKKTNAPPQVLYCGPSNKSVDVVTEYLLRIPNMKDKILRVYGSMIEEKEFSIPNKVTNLKPPVSDDELKIPEGDLQEVSLHHVIRSVTSPFSSDLQRMEAKFRDDKVKKIRTSNEEVKAYCELIGSAEEWAVAKTQIILCTCSWAGSKLIEEKCNIIQCIVDESGMCMEPEVLVPMTSSNAKQIVLIGDHKQLQPIINDNHASKLGLVKSMFERLHKESDMLKIQYRMHSSICTFPSFHFYDDMLITDDSVKARGATNVDFWPSRRGPLVLCHVEGEEKTSVISTADSGAESKYNEQEADKAVQVAKYLVNKYGVQRKDIVILTPYREQRKQISERLKGAYEDIRVTTIIKSQGSEWDYVIISLVRSVPKDEIDPEPSYSWLSNHLGFIRDEHQINVALTRAKHGLCIIGNKNLISLDSTWYSLVEHYRKQDYIVQDYQWPEESKDRAEEDNGQDYEWPDHTNGRDN